jgi:hypothetical protein
MGLNNRVIFLTALLIFVSVVNGCFVNLNNESLEEYGRKVGLTMATLVTYIGKSKNEIKRDFGEPTAIRHESGLIHTHYREEKVQFNEIWEYIYRRGIPGINAEGSIKTFFFNDDIVVSVDAF